MIEEFEKFKLGAAAAAAKSPIVKADLAATEKFINDMKRWVCNLCAGWGHQAMDSHPRKSNLFANVKEQCKTGQVIDMVIAYCKVDLDTYREEMELKPRDTLKYGFVLKDGPDPYKRRTVQVIKSSRNRTYKSDEDG